MALSASSGSYEAPEDAERDIEVGDQVAAEANASEQTASTLRPADLPPRDAATIAMPEGAFDPHDADNRPQGKDLVRPRELSPEFARRVTALWQQTRSQFKDPKETIKSEKSGIFDLGDLLVGSRVVGPVEDAGAKDYELSEVIGEGAMGIVWSARQASLDRNVAIKMPKGAATKSEMGRRQFMSEVVVTGQLDHPNIVPIYDLGKDASGQLFYSMKRVEGRPWNDLLEEGEGSQQEHLETLMKVCDAIRFAHDRGVIHRDIKPHNVMVGRYGEVSVMDWGIALRLDVDKPQNSMTRISPAGTPAYMAPEMATGSAAEIGPATDVYLLGAVLFEILTGEPPHPPPTDSEVHFQLVQDALLIAARNVITPMEQGGELIDVAYRAMATDVANRYQSVQEFQNAIREYLSHAESINLAERGENLLARAKANGHSPRDPSGTRFDDFDRARFALEEALQVWPGNRTAQTRHAETLLAYANYAYDEGAYARGIALLSEENPAHQDLLRKLKSARRRTNSLSWMLKGAVLAIIIGGSAFSYFLYRAWGDANAQRIAAEDAKNVAVSAEREALAAQAKETLAKESAIEAQKAEKKAKEDALAAQAMETRAKEDAIEAQKAEKKAKDDAIAAQAKETLAKENAIAAQKEAQRSSYVFEIGLAAEELQRNAFDRAAEILASQTSSDAKNSLRNWEWGYLNALVSLDVKSFDDRGKLLQGRIETTAVSRNREWVAAGTSGGDVYVWRFDRSEQPVRLHYGKVVNAVAITPDGSKLLAVGSSTGGRHAIKTWSLPAQDGAAADPELASHAAPILSLDLSSDASIALTSAADGSVSITPLDGAENAIAFAATSQENSIWCARFSPDDQWIATAGEDGTVRVWDAKGDAAATEQTREMRRFEGHEGPVYAVAFSPDGRNVASGGRDRRLLAFPFDPDAARTAKFSQAEEVRLRLSDASGTPRPNDAVLLGEHDAAVRSLSFASEGNVMYSAGHDHTIRVWDMANGLGSVKLLKTLRGHGGWVRSCNAMPGEEGNVLSGGYDRRVRIWNWRKYAFPLVLRNESRRSLGDLELTSGDLAPDGSWVAAASANGVVTLWDMSDPLDPKPQELAEGHDWQATTAHYFPDNRRLLTAGGDNTALVWDEKLGNELVRVGGWNEPLGAGWRGVAAVSDDGKWIATGAEDGMLARVWDAELGTPVAAIPVPEKGAWPDGEQPEATALAFAPGSKLLALGDQWGTCHLAAPNADWHLRSFPVHDGKISAIEFLPDARGIVTASSDGTVQLWSIDENVSSATSSPRSSFRHADRVVAMDLSPDGVTMITAAGSEDDRAVLRIWDSSRPAAPIHSLRLSEIWPDHESATSKRAMVRSVALHPREPRALVTLFDPQTSTYRVGEWAWNETTDAYRSVPTGTLRDVSTALFAPHRGNAFLTVGGRGARLQHIAAPASRVAMTYRPQSAIRSVSFSADGEKLISASADRSLKVWTLDRGQRRWLPDAKLVGRHDAAINSVEFHPTRSDQFLTASDDGSAKLWRLSDGVWETVQTMTVPGGNAGPLHDAIFLRGAGEDLRIVTSGVDGAYLWEKDSATPRPIQDDGSICCAASSPDGKNLVIAQGSTATIYDAVTLQPTAPAFSGHSAEITSLAFTPDGSRLFTSSRDYTVKLWEIESDVDANRAHQQRELLTLEGHADQVTSVSVGSRPKHPIVLTTGRDGQAIIWPNEANNP